MATEKRLVYAREVEEIFNFVEHECSDSYEAFKVAINKATTVDAVEVPCKIGDWVWAIRSYHGHKHPQRGIVSDMYFSNDMRLHIVVKHIARGEWGKTVFATDKEAYAAIGGRKDNG